MLKPGLCGAAVGDLTALLQTPLLFLWETAVAFEVGRKRLSLTLKIPPKAKIKKKYGHKILWVLWGKIRIFYNRKCFLSCFPSMILYFPCIILPAIFLNLAGNPWGTKKPHKQVMLCFHILLLSIPPPIIRRIFQIFSLGVFKGLWSGTAEVFLLNWKQVWISNASTGHGLFKSFPA